MTALVKSLVWLVPLAAGVVLAHGCLNPQPTAPARDDASGSDGATATTEGEGASTTTSPDAGGTATGGGIHSGSGGTASGAPNEGDAGAGGAAGATGSAEGGAPPDED